MSHRSEWKRNYAKVQSTAVLNTNGFDDDIHHQVNLRDVIFALHSR